MTDEDAYDILVDIINELGTLSAVPDVFDITPYDYVAAQQALGPRCVYIEKNGVATLRLQFTSHLGSQVTHLSPAHAGLTIYGSKLTRMNVGSPHEMWRCDDCGWTYTGVNDTGACTQRCVASPVATQATAYCPNSGVPWDDCRCAGCDTPEIATLPNIPVAAPVPEEPFMYEARVLIPKPDVECWEKYAGTSCTNENCTQTRHKLPRRTR